MGRGRVVFSFIVSGYIANIRDWAEAGDVGWQEGYLRDWERVHWVDTGTLKSDGKGRWELVTGMTACRVPT